MMARQGTPWVLWVLVGLTAVVALLESVVTIQNGAAVGQTGPGQVLGDVLILALPISFVSVGAFILTRHPDNRIGWLMVATGLGYALGSLTADYPRFDAHTYRSTRPLSTLAAWAGLWDWVLYGTALFYLLLLFPDGKFSGRRWRVVMWAGTAAAVIVSVLSAIQRGPIDNEPINNPLGLVPISDTVLGVLLVFILLSLAAAAVSSVLRFRTARGDVRQQMKWFTYGGSLAVICVIGAFATGWSKTGWSDAIALVAGASLVALPIFLGVAILRYRLYEIDVLINRTLVYGSVTISLGLVYIGAVLGIQALFRLVAGQGSDLAIAIATLLVAALFNPWRRRLQAFIDRRFYRRKYDAARTMAAFQARLRGDVDLDRLGGEVVQVLHETVQPTHVSLWLR
jgi:hypothetical protein